MADRAGAPILVIGSAGGVGRRVCAEVARQCGPDSLVLGDHRPGRAESQAGAWPGATARRVDLRDATSLSGAVDAGLATVIVCASQERPQVQRVCLERGVPCLDITIQHEFVAQVCALDARAREAKTALVAMAGLWPGLSGLMAKRAAEQLDRSDALDLALCQSTRSRVGPAGIADMLGALGQPATFRSAGRARSVAGFTLRRRISYPDPFGTRSHRLVGFVEGSVLAEALGIPEVHLWTGFDSASFDRIVALLRRLGVLDLFRRDGTRMPLARAVSAMKGLGPARPEPIALVAEVRGEKKGRPHRVRVALRGPSDYGLTAMSVVAMARLLAGRSHGAVGAGHPLGFFDLREVVDTIDHAEIEVLESVLPEDEVEKRPRGQHRRAPRQASTRLGLHPRTGEPRR